LENIWLPANKTEVGKTVEWRHHWHRQYCWGSCLFLAAAWCQ